MQPLKRLGDYEIVAELGRGGMGKVYLARRVGHGGFERLFAVKVLLEEMVEEPEAVLMFLDEANIASQIHHPNVVGTVDVGSTEQVHYLVMEYVEGCSLFELLRNNREHRPPRLIATVMLDALRGLHAAHELVDASGLPTKLVHRDFSPHNLLVGVDGNCRVTDFGVAKVSSRLTHTRRGVNKGKLSYMAPEQLSAARDIDRRVDIWAAGVVLWSSLTGAPLFRGESEAETITNILRRGVPPASIIGLKPPKCFDGVCRKALSRRRDGRYESALEMADALHAIALDEGYLAKPSEIAEWVRNSFGDELEHRRKSIRSASSSTTVPVLPRPVLADTPLPLPLDAFGPLTSPPESTMATALEEAKVLLTRRGVAGEEATAATAMEQVQAAPVAEEPTAATAIESIKTLTPTPTPDDASPRDPEPSESLERSGAIPLLEPEELIDGSSEGQASAGGRVLRSRIGLALIVGVASAVLVALLSGVVLVSSGGDPAEASPGESTSAAEDERDVIAVVDRVLEAQTSARAGVAEGPETESEAGESVRVTLRGLPEGSRITVDGEEAQSSQLLLLRAQGERVIEVSADGYQPWSMRLAPEANTIVYVELNRRRSGRRRGKAASSRYRLVRDPGF